MEEKTEIPVFSYNIYIQINIIQGMELVEIKKLLLRDFSLRLPYGLILHSISDNKDYPLKTVSKDFKVGKGKYNNGYPIENFRPYLFKIEDLTEDKYMELFHLCNTTQDLGVYRKDECIRIAKYVINGMSTVGGYTEITFDFKSFTEVLQWLLINRVDIFGLIDMNLAIRVEYDKNPYRK